MNLSNILKIRMIVLSGFFLGFADAFLVYIISAYFSQMTGSDNVGIFYLIAYSGGLISLFYLQPLIRAIGKTHSLYLFLGIIILTSASLARMEVSWLAIGLVFIFIMASNMTWVVVDILLESLTPDKHTGKIRGSYLTIMNAGLLVSPFLSTWVLDRFHYRGIFTILIVMYLIILVFAGLFVRRITTTVFTPDNKISKKDFKRIYLVSFSMEFFYAMMIVYTPLYLRSLDFSWNDIGIIFAIMLTPFVLLQYPIGKLADKIKNEKSLLFIALFILGTSTIYMYFIDSRSLFIWGTVLFITRIGVACIEVLRDSYFFRRIDGDDIELISKFRTARPVANISGALISAAILIFLPIKFIFLLVGMVAFAAVYYVSKLDGEDSEMSQAL